MPPVRRTNDRSGGGPRAQAERRTSGRPAPRGGTGSGRGGDRRSAAERAAARTSPELPEDAAIGLLDPQVRADLHGLGKGLADAVGAHLAAAGLLIDEDPVRALAHARYARARAPRVASVREAVGVAAYTVGEYTEALAELRAARRISGDPGTLALIADCERALGRPERALSALNDPGLAALDPEDAAEVILVVAGARRDLGQHDAALVTLARAGIDPDRPSDSSGRIWYAYADTLAEMGRTEEAKLWFARAADREDAADTDAADRAHTG